MGFGTTLFTSIYYSHKTYNSLAEVQDDIEQLNNFIGSCKDTINNFMFMTEPAKFWRESEAEAGETPMIWMENEIRSQMEAMGEYIAERERLYILEGAWGECHDKEGKAIKPPETIHYDSSYIHGDFIGVNSVEDLK